MHFNVKLFEYPNGEKQLRYYSTPQFIPDELPQGLEIEHLIKKREIYERTHEKEPFGGEWVKIVDEFDDCPVKSDSDNLHSVMVSANRSKNSVYTYARCEFWEWFVTFTINSEKKDRYDYSECSKAVRDWLDNQKQRFAPELKYLVVPEMHKDGAWHFHALLCNCGDIKFVYSGHKDKKGNLIFNLDSYRLGFTTATRVKDYHKVAKYIGKYITKSLCELTKGKQRYYVSKSINKPETRIMCFDKSENDLYDFVVTLANSTGQELKYVSSVGNDKSYTKVKYFEIQ